MPSYYDRTYPVERVSGGKATLASSSILGGVGPHGATTRWSYTAPTGAAAQVENVQITYDRDAVAAPAGLTLVLVSLSPAGYLVFLESVDNVVGSAHTVHLTDCGHLAPGETIACQTSDASTGGTNRYITSAHYREYFV